MTALSGAGLRNRAQVTRWSGALGIRVLVALLSGATLLRLASVSDVAAFGRFHILFMAAQLVGGISESGMASVVQRLLPSFERAGPSPRGTYLVAMAFRRSTRMWLVAAPPVVVVSVLLVGSSLAAAAVLLVAGFGLIASWMALVEAVLVARGRPSLSQVPRVVAWSMVGGLALVAPPATLAGVAMLLVAGFAVGLVVALALPAIRSDGGESASAADRALVEAQVDQRRFSMASIRVLNVVVPSAEGALLSIVLSPSDLGTFAVARTVARPMTVVASAMVAVVSPGLVLRHDRGGAGAVWSHMRSIIARTVPIAAVLWGLGGLAIAWAGPANLSEYHSLVPVSLLLLAAGAVNLGTGPVGAGMQMSDGEAALLRITVFTSVAHLGVVAGLGLVWGVTAAAGGAVFSQLLNNLLCIRRLRPSSANPVR